MQEIIKKQFSCQVKSINEPTDSNNHEIDLYLSTYDVDLGGDIIVKGAFDESIQNKISNNKNIPVLWQHDQSKLLGHGINFKSDSKGLMAKAILPKDHWRVKNEVMPLLKNGSLTDISVGFSLAKGDYYYDEKNNIRVINKGNLLEFSFVSIGMNPEAEIQSYKSIEVLENLKEVEKLLKSKGFSNSEAKTLISKVKEFSKTREESKETSQRDVETKQQPEINLEETLKTIQELTLINKINQLCLKTK